MGVQENFPGRDHSGGSYLTSASKPTSFLVVEFSSRTFCSGLCSFKSVHVDSNEKMVFVEDGPQLPFQIKRRIGFSLIFTICVLKIF